MPYKLASPSIPRPPEALPVELLPGRCEWVSQLGYTKMVLDTAAFDFHMDVAPEALQPVVAAALEQARRLGFEPIPDDECEPELLRNGSTRIYLVPVTPVDDSPLIPAHRGRGRLTSGAAGLLVLAGAALLNAFPDGASVAVGLVA